MAIKTRGMLTQPEVFPVNDGRGFAFQTKDINTIARQRYMDDFGFYQSRFGLFSYMKLSKLNKFIINNIKGHPLMLQPMNSCSIEPTGSLRIGKRELEAVPAVIKEKFCWDELLDSCFEHFINFSEGGEIEMDEDGMAMFGLLMDEMQANAALATRLSLTTGRFYDVNNVDYNAQNTAELKSLFRKTHPTWEGWVKIAYDAAQSDFPHLNVDYANSSVVNYNTDFDDQGNFKGEISDVFDGLKEKATKSFRKVINRGGVIAGGRFRFTPLFVVSDSFYSAVIREWNALANQVATTRSRLKEVTVGGENGSVPQSIMYIDNIPIVPLSDISGFDEYIQSNTHFAGIIGSGNINLGLSFSDIPQNVEDGIAMMFGHVSDMTRDDYGTYVFLSHMLGRAAIADADYMVSTIGMTKD